MPSKPAVHGIVHMLRKKSSVIMCLQLHAHMYRYGLHSHSSVGNILVFLLVQAGHVSTAADVFNVLLIRTEKSWNSMLQSYAKFGNPRCALSLYHRMQEAFVVPSPTAIATLLKACAKLKDVENGQHINARIAGTGLLESNPFVGTALMDMYAKCGMLERVEDVFDRMIERDVVSWNAMIGGYILFERGEDALQCFEQMPCHGFVPDAVTYACSLKTCGSTKSIKRGQEIHANVKIQGMLKTSQIVSNALVDMYAKCGSLGKAKDVFDLLPVRDVVSWNALISGYVQSELYEEALHHFDKMQLEGVAGDAVTYASVLKASGSIAASNKGQAVHFDAQQRGLLDASQLVGNSLVDMYVKCGLLAKAKEVFDNLPNRDTVSWNTLIAGYVQHEQCEEALEIFERMKRQGFTPNAVTFACTLNACGSIGAIEKGMEIHFEVQKSGLLNRNQVVGNALVDVYAKCGILEKAQEVFDMLPARNVISWNALVTGYAQAGKVKNVLGIIDQMNRDGINPNLVTFLLLLTACSHSGTIDETHTYCQAMTESFGFLPLSRHHICIVDLLSRAGRLDHAKMLVENAQCHPNRVMWVSMLSACREW